MLNMLIYWFHRSSYLVTESKPETISFLFIHPNMVSGTSSNHRSGSVPGSVDRRTFGIPYNIPRHIPSQSTISVIGNNDLISANCELSHSLGKMNLGSQNMASFHDFRDGIHNGMQFNSPNTMSAMAMNINSTLVSNGIDSRSMRRVGSIGNTSHSFELNKSGKLHEQILWYILHHLMLGRFVDYLCEEIYKC